MSSWTAAILGSTGFLFDGGMEVEGSASLSVAP